MLDSKFFKDIVEKSTHNYQTILSALDIVQKFILEKKRILYGGMAIHFNLLNVGHSGIYEEGVIPDYDFMSPDFYNDSIELANILHDAGYKGISCINATHCTSRKVRIDFVPVADMTYIPKDVYNKLPYNTYKGMRIIHPDFQRADMHRAFNIPYNNPPMEVALHRLEKDQKRFNLLNETYPVKAKVHKYKLADWKKVPEHGLITGVQAFHILNKLADVITDKAEFKWDMIDDRLEVVTDKPEICIDTKKATCYMRYLELRSKAWELDDLYVIDNWGELLPYYDLEPIFKKFNIDVKHKIKIAHPSHLLMFFMQQYFETNDEKYRFYYISTLNLVSKMEQYFLTLNSKSENTVKYEDLPYFMGVKTLGEINMSIDVIANTYKDLLRAPFGYYPPKTPIDWPIPLSGNIVFETLGIKTDDKRTISEITQDLKNQSEIKVEKELEK